MNRKGEFSIVQIVKPILILILVVAILIWAGPAYTKIRESLGFQVGLTIEEQKVQDQIIDSIDNDLIPNLYTCKDSIKEGCFCLVNEFSLPTDYKIEFSREDDSTMLTFYNHRNGKFLEKWIGGVKPCVDNNFVFTELSDEKVSLSFSSIIEAFFNLNGKDVRKEVDGDFMFYKPEQGSICVVSEEMSNLRDKENICD